MKAKSSRKTTTFIKLEAVIEYIKEAIRISSRHRTRSRSNIGCSKRRKIIEMAHFARININSCIGLTTLRGQKKCSLAASNNICIINAINFWALDGLATNFIFRPRIKSRRIREEGHLTANKSTLVQFSFLFRRITFSPDLICFYDL